MYHHHLKHIAMAAAAVSLSVSCVRDDGGNHPAREYVRVGMTVPAFSVSGEGGRTFDSPEGFAGRTTLLLFFATWCPDCQAELPVIDAVWQTVAGEPGYDVVAISRGGAEGRYEQSPDILSRYWKDHDLRMPWYLDGDRSVFDRFASAGIPRVYIVNAEGVVVWQSAAPELDAAGYLALLRHYR